MRPAVRRVLRLGVAPMVAGLVLVLVGLYLLPPRDPAGGWGPVLWGTLVVVGLALLVVPLFCVVIPHLLPPEE